MNIFLIAALFGFLQEDPIEPPKLEKPAKKKGEWKSTWAARVDLEYDTNIWRLDGDDQDRLLDDLAGDQISGRFDGMESIEDWIITPSIRFATKGPSPFGRKLEAHAKLEWNQYAVNPDRSHLRAAIGAEQNVGKDGRLDLDLELIPQYFQKNYLADATDFTGSVAASERVYEAGDYRQFAISLRYRHRFVEETDAEFDGLVSLGVRDRAYSSPFRERNEIGVPFEFGVRAGGWQRVKAALALRFEPIASPGDDAVVLLDEPFFGVDLNGDGDNTDMNARSVQEVDRSRLETSFVFGVEVQVTETFTAGFAWTRTWKEWDSDGAFDVDHRDRSDVQDVIELQVRVQVTPDWEGRVTYEHTMQSTDRPGDPGSSGEVSDYKRDTFTISAIFRW